MQKPVQFLWVSSLPDGELAWEKMTDPMVERPSDETLARLAGDRTVHGKVRLENELQVTLVFTGDEAAHERVMRSSRDIVSLVQEWMIPIPFVFAMTHGDQLAHLARPEDPTTTLCGLGVRRMVNHSQADRCPECARLATADAIT